MKSYSFLHEFVIATGLALAGTALSSALMMKRLHASRQITKYVKKMTMELQRVKPDDRNKAKQIIESYCYNIGAYSQQQFNDLPIRKKVKLQRRNFNGRQYCISQLYIPLMKIINNINDRDWKTTMLSCLNNARVQRFTSNLISNMFSLAGIGLSAGYVASTWDTPWNGAAGSNQNIQVNPQ